MKKKLTALLIDGEPGIRALLQDFLSPLGFVVFETGLTRQALSFISEYDFSLVFFEVDLPGTTCQHFYEEACRVRPALCERFIFMTCGLTEEPKGNRFLCIGKPFDFRLLHEAIRGVVEGHGEELPKATTAIHRALP